MAEPLTAEEIAEWAAEPRPDTHHVLGRCWATVCSLSAALTEERRAHERATSEAQSRMTQIVLAYEDRLAAAEAARNREVGELREALGRIVETNGSCEFIYGGNEGDECPVAKPTADRVKWWCSFCIAREALATSPPPPPPPPPTPTSPDEVT